jgi:hypothetical protein
MTPAAFLAYAALVALLAMILLVMFDDNGGGPSA